MKSIEIDDDLYTYIASQTKHIGESASQILRRLLLGDENAIPPVEQPTEEVETAEPAVVDVEPPSIEAATQFDGSIFELLAKNNLAEQTSRVELFLAILGGLHQVHNAEFSKVLKVRGRNRLYFGESKEQLLEAGSSTNPKQIPGSSFWVVTNNNTAKKESMLSEVADVLGYSTEDAQKLLKIFGS